MINLTPKDKTFIDYCNTHITDDLVSKALKGKPAHRQAVDQFYTIRPEHSLATPDCVLAAVDLVVPINHELLRYGSVHENYKQLLNGSDKPRQEELDRPDFKDAYPNVAAFMHLQRAATAVDNAIHQVYRPLIRARVQEYMQSVQIDNPDALVDSQPLNIRYNHDSSTTHSSK